MNEKPIIWVVDDHQMVLDLTEFRLRTEINSTIRKFASAEEAMVKLEHETPDLLIVDYTLNSGHQKCMNGLQFMRAMDHHGIKVPTIVLSGQNDKEKAVEMLKIGAVDYISKDDQNFIQDLLESVQDVLRYVLDRDKSTVLEQNIRKNIWDFGVGLVCFLAILLSVKLLIG